MQVVTADQMDAQDAGIISPEDWRRQKLAKLKAKWDLYLVRSDSASEAAYAEFGDRYQVVEHEGQFILTSIDAQAGTYCGEKNWRWVLPSQRRVDQKLKKLCYDRAYNVYIRPNGHVADVAGWPTNRRS